MEPLPVELMNTVRAGHDALATREEALAWLRGVDAWPEVVREWLPTPRGLRLDELRELRDALRVLAADVTGRASEGDPDAAADVVNRCCALAPQWSSLRWPAAREPRSAGRPGELLLSLLAEGAVELFTGEQRSALRACLAPNCVRYFVKQHPRREWCCAGCGNRARVARHYERHHH
ncbi:hypothetical protein FPZ12_012600 [Amycolatopsis acidicola]|uniref:Zinc finger CGNR domain-containing protein n=1 Tax=Amycolatopsis acidicola TaxID=2596893 RepID=A0A5N0VAR7_9PSEU|nr:ABATE domain-containing protein [Amycolatopsis acidicola]KAA9162071.1 hypothetical protein FPZ12_012600 [Amycolatopsis acidicola]